MATVDIPGDKFKSPALAAQLDVYLILARSWREVLPEHDRLDGKNLSWIDALKVFGILAGKDIPRFANTNQVADLWQSFLANPRISALPQPSLDLLTKAKVRSIELAGQGGDHSILLGEASEAAHRLIADLITANRLGAVLASPAPVAVRYDPDGRFSCASANALEQKIQWAFQPHLAHSIHGLIICDYVFAHEYLSHLLLPNPHFDSNVRERWLVATLIHTVISAPRMPRWKHLLWMDYHKKVLGHVNEELERQDPERTVSDQIIGELVQNSAAELYKGFPAQFWSMTREIYSSSDDNEKCRLISRVIQKIDSLASQLENDKIRTFNELDKL